MTNSNQPYNPINRPITPELESLLSPSSQHLLADKEEKRKVIPQENIQEAMKRIATWVTGAAGLPSQGEVATLTYNDGHTQSVEVVEWDKDFVGVKIPGAGNSNFDTSAFVNLVHEPSQTQDQSKS